MKPDPVIAEVRAARNRISAKFGHDTARLARHYKQLDQQLQKSGQYRFVTGFFSTAEEKTAGRK